MADDYTSDAAEPADHTAGKRALGDALDKTFTQYKKDRVAAELQWMNNLRQYLGKYDPDVQALMAPGRSKAYPKRTRVKCMSMVSRLMSLLFPAGEKNWKVGASTVPNLPVETLVTALDGWRVANPGVAPTQETLDQLVHDTAKEIALLQEKIIEDQLQDVDPHGASDYETLVRKVVFSAVLYGPGVAKGPMVVAEKATKYLLDASGIPQVLEVDAYRPYWEFVPCWNYYPDLSAPTFEQMEGEFQRHIYSKHQLLQFAERGDVDGEAIREFVRQNPDGNYVRSSHENEMQGLGGQGSPTAVGCKFELVEYWGSCAGDKLAEAGAADLSAEDRASEAVRYTALLLGKNVVKVAKNPLPEGTKVFHQFVFEEDEVNLMGSGLPPIMRDSQLAVSSFSRMLIDNAASVCGPNVEVDMDLISASQSNNAIEPFKVWMKDGGSQGQRAVHSISFDSHITELLSAIERFDTFADGETFISPMTGGDTSNVPGEALRTTGGASMIMGAAALPFRDIVRNFDRFTMGVITALVRWNKLYSVDADRLQGDVRPIAKGASSLMAKEVRANALDQLSQTLRDDERIYVDTKALLVERLRVRDLPVADLMASDEEVQQRQATAAQQTTEQQQQQQQMFAAQLRDMEADALKSLAQAQKNLTAADVSVFKALVEAINNGADAAELTRIAGRTTQGSLGSQGQPAAPGVGAQPQAGAGQDQPVTGLLQ